MADRVKGTEVLEFEGLQFKNLSAAPVSASASGHRILYIKNNSLYVLTPTGTEIDLGIANYFSNSTSNPTVTDDSNAGFVLGHFWLNTSTDVLYLAVDVTPGAAVWRTVVDTTTILPSLAVGAALPANTLAYITDTTATNAKLRIQGSASQSANIFEVVSSTGNAILRSTGSNVYVGALTPAGTRLGVTRDSSATSGLAIIAGTGTADSAETFAIQDQSGNKQVTISAGGATVFNEQGKDQDFRIEGDTDANLFVVDASVDRVGIGTASPGSKLSVIGSDTITTQNVAATANLFTNQSSALITGVKQGVNATVILQGSGGSSNTIVGVIGGVNNQQTSGTHASLIGIMGFNTFSSASGTSTVSSFAAVFGSNNIAANAVGTITLSSAFLVGSPSYGAGATATIGDSAGIVISNQGLAAASASYGLDIRAQSGSTTTIAIRTANGAVIFNENGTDSDTRIEGDTDQNLIVVDASVDRVGVGIALPLEKLHVVGNIRSTGYLDCGEIATPATPPANFGRIWLNTSGVLQFTNDAGTTTTLSAASGSTPFRGFRATKSSNQAYTSGARRLITFDGESFDTDNWFDLSTERFTPLVSGYYDINAIVSFSNRLDGLIEVRKNGTTTELFGQTNNATYAAGSFDYCVTVSGPVFMNGSTDYLELYINSNSFNGTVYGTWTIFSAQFIGS